MTPENALHWIRNHDESWLFVIGYVALAVVLSIWISLFWLAAVVAVHLGFEIVRQSSRFESWPRVLAEALWEVKLDIALVIGALVLALYLETIFGILGLRSAGQLGAAAKSGAKIGVRVGGWDQAIRGVLLTVDDAVQVLRSLAMRKKRNGASQSSLQEGRQPREASDSSPFDRSSWAWGDYITLGLLAAFALLLPLAPALTDHSIADSLTILMAELHPFPSKEN